MSQDLDQVAVVTSYGSVQPKAEPDVKEEEHDNIDLETALTTL